MKRVVIYGGKTGWIGGLMHELLKKEGEYVQTGINSMIDLHPKPRN